MIRIANRNSPMKLYKMVQAGFGYHHAEPAYLMLTLWLPDGPCTLPPNASHQVGVGAFVLNDKNEVLIHFETRQ